ncbi:MAG: methionyl-tRNA formyltransferase [Alphaproteobacteria bacterium]|nr:methionyl-tRNA formyltransferase [Alphaproteobacteria bacterium]
MREKKRLRIAFMGTPDFAVPSLRALIDSGHDVVCVYTQPPRPKGRGRKVQPSPVHALAEAHNIEVRTPKGLRKPERQEAFAALDLDVAVVAAYGLILPAPILEAPRYGCLNVHASLLPRWRGASPIQHAILHGDSESGVCIMQMDAGLDTGGIISCEKIAIGPRTTASDLYDTLAVLGAQMAEKAVNQLAADGSLSSTPQPEEGMTYAPLLRREDGRIDWTRHATEIDRQIRALNPWPGVFIDKAGERVKILEAVPSPETSDTTPGTLLGRGGKVSCGGESVLILNRIQPSGKKPMDVDSAVNGGFFTVGGSLA